jgi:alcohol dehydrogenase class IV
MARFTLPRDIYYGSGAIDELKNLKGYKKAMILTGGSSMKRGGFLQKVEDILHEIGVEPSFSKASNQIRLSRPSLKVPQPCANSFLTLSSLSAAVHL